ncbi:hypothetical protein M9H77_18101 [Catharanthus roseus]|uniref:Uncharacterized protein n=1 Tax=Catharanthus roseus TaxID=4058 RepID=A0ACC0B6K4_CATRO|nr:hypothetical protein M9H77_18101 [Catharanthus roseus]
MSGGNGDIQNIVQDIGALQDRMDAQEAAVRTLEVNLDQRFRLLDQRFDEMINRFDALGNNNDYYGGDFRLKVDIPSFYDILQEKRVKLVACRLKGGAFAWWERLPHRR